MVGGTVQGVGTEPVVRLYCGALMAWLIAEATS